MRLADVTISHLSRDLKAKIDDRSLNARVHFGFLRREHGFGKRVFP
jgi:hypothetical protein